ncbi:nucleotidyltransferase family protein [Maricaulis sp.]|uniref:nucleotidyltransferase family protein n=1 Tax=Maricaulis sp. TaxID=1486257 RepID=UPI00262A9DC8|nr:nucleotidyltransferase family protein [Maricaulis sp.]
MKPRIARAEQEAFVLDAVLANPLHAEILRRVSDMGLPDCALMAGSVYKAVWNKLTGRPADHGINDYDLAYFDAADLSAESEAAIAARVVTRCEDLGVEVEACNQARVHLWFNAQYGTNRPPLRSTEDAVRNFASRTHSVALACKPDGRPFLVAPFGYDELLSLHVKPVADLAGAASWNRKCAAQKAVWPELRFDLVDI